MKRERRIVGWTLALVSIIALVILVPIWVYQFRLEGIDGYYEISGVRCMGGHQACFQVENGIFYKVYLGHDLPGERLGVVVKEDSHWTVRPDKERNKQRYLRVLDGQVQISMEGDSWEHYPRVANIWKLWFPGISAWWWRSRNG